MTARLCEIRVCLVCKEPQTVSSKVAQLFYVYQQCLKIPASPHSCQYLVLPITIMVFGEVAMEKLA